MEHKRIVTIGQLQARLAEFDENDGVYMDSDGKLVLHRTGIVKDSTPVLASQAQTVRLTLKTCRSEQEEARIAYVISVLKDYKYDLEKFEAEGSLKDFARDHASQIDWSIRYSSPHDSDGYVSLYDEILHHYGVGSVPMEGTKADWDLYHEQITAFALAKAV